MFDIKAMAQGFIVVLDYVGEVQQVSIVFNTIGEARAYLALLRG